MVVKTRAQASTLIDDITVYVHSGHGGHLVWRNSRDIESSLGVDCLVLHRIFLTNPAKIVTALAHTSTIIGKIMCILPVAVILVGETLGKTNAASA